MDWLLLLYELWSSVNFVRLNVDAGLLSGLIHCCSMRFIWHVIYEHFLDFINYMSKFYTYARCLTRKELPAPVEIATVAQKRGILERKFASHWHRRTHSVSLMESSQHLEPDAFRTKWTDGRLLGRVANENSFNSSFVLCGWHSVFVCDAEK